MVPDTDRHSWLMASRKEMYSKCFTLSQRCDAGYQDAFPALADGVVSPDVFQCLDDAHRLIPQLRLHADETNFAVASSDKLAHPIVENEHELKIECFAPLNHLTLSAILTVGPDSLEEFAHTSAEPSQSN